MNVELDMKVIMHGKLGKETLLTSFRALFWIQLEEVMKITKNLNHEIDNLI